MPIFKPLPGASLDLAHPLSRGLNGCWLLGDGGSRANDSGPLKNHGIASGLVAQPWVGAPFGGLALNINAAGEINAGSNNHIATGKVSVCCWIRPAVLTRGDLVTVWTGGTGNSQFNLLYGLNSGKPQFFVSSGTSANSDVGSTVMVTNRWYFVCGAFDVANVKVYLNGRLEASTASTLTLGSGSGISRLFGDNANGDGQSDAVIENVRIYDRALSDAEIAWLYAEPYAGFLSQDYDEAFVAAAGDGVRAHIVGGGFGGRVIGG